MPTCVNSIPLYTGRTGSPYEEKVYEEKGVCLYMKRRVCVSAMKRRVCVSPMKRRVCVSPMKRKVCVRVSTDD